MMLRPFITFAGREKTFKQQRFHLFFFQGGADRATHKARSPSWNNHRDFRNLLIGKKLFLCHTGIMPECLHLEVIKAGTLGFQAFAEAVCKGKIHVVASKE